MTTHELAAHLLTLPDVEVYHFDPSRAGYDDEVDTSLSVPIVEMQAEYDVDQSVTSPSRRFATICGPDHDHTEAE